MLPFETNIIAAVRRHDLMMAATLDAHGLLLRDDDDWEALARRLEHYAHAYGELEQQLATGEEVTLFDHFRCRRRQLIPPAIMAEAAAATHALYAFSIAWVPGFFLSRGIGPLWGGCAITDPENLLTIFLIRGNFARHPRWFIYHRAELLAHELCHAARMVLDDYRLEEYFAYQTAHSRLRRYLGNCFRTPVDAILFLIPIMLLPLVEIFRIIVGGTFPVWPFWLLAALYPLFM
ncbi:MAG: hypothetical protein PHQ27_06995, partial [Victivallales bacterium]|nr:hypothetical protein [Victivallales bacterium]